MPGENQYPLDELSQLDQEMGRYDETEDPMSKPQFYILHSHRSYYSHEGDDGDHDAILAIGTSEDELREKWNKSVQAKLDDVAHLHESYRRNLPLKMDDGSNEVSYSNAGGGCHVRTTISIKPWEDKL